MEVLVQGAPARAIQGEVPAVQVAGARAVVAAGVVVVTSVKVNVR